MCALAKSDAMSNQSRNRLTSSVIMDIGNREEVVPVILVLWPKAQVHKADDRRQCIGTVEKYVDNLRQLHSRSCRPDITFSTQEQGRELGSRTGQHPLLGSRLILVKQCRISVTRLVSCFAVSISMLMLHPIITNIKLQIDNLTTG